MASCLFIKLLRTDQNDKAVSLLGVPVVGDHFYVGRGTDWAVNPCAPPPAPRRFSGPTALSSESETPS